MHIISADDVARLLPYTALINALEDAFQSDFVVPDRHHHTIAQRDGDATLLLMPAWTVPTGSDAPDAASPKSFLGCKIVTVFPGNAGREKPALYGSYLLMAGETGEPLALIDGAELTARRTAAASALAARFLARADASRFLMVGAGALSTHLIRAHATVRPIIHVTLWNRTRARAEQLAAHLASDHFAVDIADNLEDATRWADVISCATLTAEPLIHGAWIKPGAHVDLVGGFTPTMREADDEILKRARLYVDTRAGALKEAGDIVDPIQRGVITQSDIAGELAELCRNGTPARRHTGEITLFKSVGTAIEDLAAAMLVWRGLTM